MNSSKLIEVLHATIQVQLRNYIGYKRLRNVVQSVFKKESWKHFTLSEKLKLPKDQLLLRET